MASFLQPDTITAQAVRSQTVTIAFCSLAASGFVADAADAHNGHPSKMSTLNEFRSHVRTTLMLLGGIECQEKEGAKLYIGNNSNCYNAMAPLRCVPDETVLMQPQLGAICICHHRKSHV